jgi:hypothetical protein
LEFDGEAGVISGTPAREGSGPVPLEIAVYDGERSARATATLAVLSSTAVGAAKEARGAVPRVSPIDLRMWASHGFGFLVIIMFGFVGLSSIEQIRQVFKQEYTESGIGVRWWIYRAVVGISTIGACAALAVWLRNPGGLW